MPTPNCLACQHSPCRCSPPKEDIGRKEQQQRGPASSRPTPSAPALDEMYSNAQQQNPPRLVTERLLTRPSRSPAPPPAPLSPPPPAPQEFAKNPHFSAHQNAYDYLDDHGTAERGCGTPLGKLLANSTTKPIGLAPQSSRGSWISLSRNASIRMVRNGHSFMHRLYAESNGAIFKICLVELLLAAFLLATGILCARKTNQLCPDHSGIWTSSVFLGNVLIGLLAAKWDTVNLYVAHLLCSVLSIVLAALGAALSARNWQQFGAYEPAGIEVGGRIDDEKLRQMYGHCFQGGYNAARISHIYRHGNRNNYDFLACVHDVKIGIAANSIQFVLQICLGVLFTVSAICCLYRVCTCGTKQGQNRRRRKSRG